ncbi:MAG: tyrosine-type recombinase/integrase [Anaerolineae bacterium]|nr:tyrosine-type recombinase/integrase [Anaerolineae bacterium]
MVLVAKVFGEGTMVDRAVHDAPSTRCDWVSTVDMGRSDDYLSNVTGAYHVTAIEAMMHWHTSDPTHPIGLPDHGLIATMFESWLLDAAALGRRQLSPRTVAAYLADAYQLLGWLERQSLPASWNGPVELFDMWRDLVTAGAMGIPLLLVTPDTMRAFMEWLAGPGHGTHGGSHDPRAVDGRYSPATLAKKSSALTTFFRFAENRHLTYGNPLTEIGCMGRPVGDQGDSINRSNALTSSQAKRLLMALLEACVTAKNPEKLMIALRDRAMIELMLCYGLRNPEVSSLDVVDYQADTKRNFAVLHIRCSNGINRVLVLDPDMREDLNSWLAARALCRFDSLAMFTNLHGGSAAGQRLSQRSIRERVDIVLERAGLKTVGMSCHALRHSYATLHIEAKGQRVVNRGLLAANMGLDARTMDRYVDWLRLEANPAAPLMEIRTAAKRQVEVRVGNAGDSDNT